MSQLIDRVLALLPDARLHLEDEESDDVIVWGPPGTGKTTSLNTLLDAHLRAGGTPPEEILVNAFTRNATRELQRRLREGFGIDRLQMPWVRTVHSSCFRLLGLQPRQVVGPNALREFGEAARFTFKGVLGKRDVEDPYSGSNVLTLGDWCYVAEELRRQRQQSLVEMVASLLGARPPFAASWGLELAQEFSREYAAWKRQKSLYDFADMLETVLRNQIRPPITQMFVDEAQDNTTLVWAVIDMWRQGARRLFIFGDDDQALYEWSGADPRGLWARRGSQFVLSHSYRLNERTHRVALSFIQRNRERVPKDFEPDRDGGRVQRLVPRPDSAYDGWEQIDFAAPGSWLLLCRNRVFLKEARQALLHRGVAFRDRTSDEGTPASDSDIGRAVDAIVRLRQGEPIPKMRLRHLRSMLRPDLWSSEPAFLPPTAALTDLVSVGAPSSLPELIRGGELSILNLPHEQLLYLQQLLDGHGCLPEPRVELGTIHSVKGEEADNVVVSTAMTQRTYQEYVVAPDSENRVYYVGATRARNNLILRVDGGRGYVV